jgi:hypothetical protein
MSRVWLGVVAPVFASAVVCAVALTAPISTEVARGVAGGVLIALAQSLASIAAMKWTWTTKWFYWAWGGGMFFRMAVFAITGFVVYRGVGWNFLSTMISLVVATTVFLVFESMTIFGKR